MHAQVIFQSLEFILGTECSRGFGDSGKHIIKRGQVAIDPESGSEILWRHSQLADHFRKRTLQIALDGFHVSLHLPFIVGIRLPLFHPQLCQVELGLLRCLLQL